MDAPGATIGHAEIQIGDSRVMLSDENPAWGAKAPTSGVSPPVQLMIYVEDVDATFKRALAAGAKETTQVILCGSNVLQQSCGVGCDTR